VASVEPIMPEPVAAVVVVEPATPPVIPGTTAAPEVS
jgi:hypothetical protein